MQVDPAGVVQNTPISSPAAIVAPSASQRAMVSSSSAPAQMIGSCVSFSGNPRTIRQQRGERAGAVVAGADHHRVGHPFEAPRARIEGTIEEVLHRAGHVAEVLGSREDDSVAPDQVGRPGVGRDAHAHVDRFDVGMRGAAPDGARHRGGLAGLGVIDDQEMLHAA